MNLPARQETRVLSLGWKVPLEKGMAIHSSILAWRIAWTEKPGGLQFVGSKKVRHDWVTNPVHRGTRDQIANIRWRIEKAREYQRSIYFCFIDYAKAFDCADHSKLWKILKEMGIPDHLTCLLRNLYAGQEATVKTGQGTTDWFKIGKGVHQGCILSSWLFNLHAEVIMLGWKKHKLESRLPRETSITSDMQMIPHL